MDFKKDFTQIMKRDLKSINITPKPEWDSKVLCIKYIDIIRRHVFGTKYTIVRSDAFPAVVQKLSIPERKAFKDISNRLMRGETLFPYLSNSILSTSMEESDYLLKNWDIYHAHLGAITNGKEKSERSDNLLFFILKDKTAYYIDIKNHPRGSEWFVKSVIEKAYDNWSSLFEKNIYIDAVDVDGEISDKEMHNTLKRSVAFVKIRDVVMVPMNLGVTSSGDSIYAVRTADDIFYELAECEKWLKEDENKIKKCVEKEQGIIINKSLNYELIIENEDFVAYETNYLIKIKLFKTPWR